MMICNNLKSNYVNSLKQIIFSLEKNCFRTGFQYCNFHSGLTAYNLYEYSMIRKNTNTRNNFYSRYYSVSDNIKNEKSKVLVTEESVENPKNIDLNKKETVKADEYLSRKEKLKKAVKEYGSTVIVFHIGISLISLGSCYLLVSMGLDTNTVFNVLGINKLTNTSQIAGSAGTFAIAYAVHKVFAPVRIAITLTSVPFIVRYLRKTGLLKHK